MKTRLLIFIFAIVAIGVGVFSISITSSIDDISNPKSDVNSTFSEDLISDKDFVFGFYSKVAEQNPESNLFFSPLGISMAFSLAYEGAEGETARQMQQTFDFEKDDKKRGEMVAELLERLDSKDLYRVTELDLQKGAGGGFRRQTLGQPAPGVNGRRVVVGQEEHGAVETCGARTSSDTSRHGIGERREVRSGEPLPGRCGQRVIGVLVKIST